MNGGAGSDTFFYGHASDGGDTIPGFSIADDTIAISAAGFGGGLVAGTPLVAGSNFVADANPTATTTDGAFLYDTNNGDLSWDADGSGVGSSVLIAELTPALALTIDDFAVV
jgi:hypothetical protein